jgi:hypothetical protein
MRIPGNIALCCAAILGNYVARCGGGGEVADKDTSFMFFWLFVTFFACCKLHVVFFVFCLWH